MPAEGELEKHEIAIRLYQGTGTPVQGIADALGVSRQTIHRWIEDAGIPKRSEETFAPVTDKEYQLLVESATERRRAEVARTAILAALERIESSRDNLIDLLGNISGRQSGALEVLQSLSELAARIEGMREARHSENLANFRALREAIEEGLRPFDESLLTAGAERAILMEVIQGMDAVIHRVEGRQVTIAEMSNNFVTGFTKVLQRLNDGKESFDGLFELVRNLAGKVDSLGRELALLRLEQSGKNVSTETLHELNESERTWRGHVSLPSPES